MAAKAKVNLVYDLDGFRKWEFDWLRYLMQDFDVQLVADTKHDFVSENTILAASSCDAARGTLIGQHLRAFRKRGLKVGIFHLSDEFGASPVNFYKDAAFVFRNYYRRSALRFESSHFFALGYKSGFAHLVNPKPITERPHKWSFAGQMKTTRTEMLKQAKRISGGYCHLTETWDDPKGLDTAQYANLLSDTVFVLCPRGNQSVDCFRVYEALEAGAIPVVEDQSISESALDMFRPNGRSLLSKFHPREWLHNAQQHGFGSYWTTAYGCDFPCPRLTHWEQLESLLPSIDIEKTAIQVGTWWHNYKQNLVNKIRVTIEETFAL